MKFFLIPAILLAIQSVLSLRAGFRFLKLIRKNRGRPPGNYRPTASVIIPCKGLDEDLRQNARKFLVQDYPSYEVIFALASDCDPAYKFLAELACELPAGQSLSTRKMRIAVAGYSDQNGEKVNNLLAGVAAVNADSDVLVFADIDAHPGRDWLSFLVAPLEDPDVTVSTGYRWYLPSVSLASRLRAAWDSSIATMMGEHSHNFAWGGSTAIRRSEFTRLRVAEKYWQRTVSDDYAITRAVRDAGGKIRFESRCLLPSQGGSSLADFLRWTNRQIIITRVYAARYWRLGLASYSLYGATFIWGLVLLVTPGLASAWKITTGAFLAGILILGMMKGVTRRIAALELFPSERSALARYGGSYWHLTPLIPWIMLFNFVTAAFTRRIEWCGTVYDLRSRDELKIVRRQEP